MNDDWFFTDEQMRIMVEAMTPEQIQQLIKQMADQADAMDRMSKPATIEGRRGNWRMPLHLRDEQ